MDEVVVVLMALSFGITAGLGLGSESRSVGVGIFMGAMIGLVVGIFSMMIWASTHVSERETGVVSTAPLLALEDIYLMEGEYKSRDIYTFRTQLGSTSVTSVVDQAFRENSTVVYDNDATPHVTYKEREKVTDWPFFGEDIVEGEGLFVFVVPSNSILPAHGIDAS